MRYTGRQLLVFNTKMDKDKPEKQTSKEIKFEFPPYLKRNKTNKFDIHFIDIASRATAAGFTQRDLAFLFDVTEATIARWKKENLLFKRAIEDGKKMQLKRLIASGLRNAVGYDYQVYDKKITYDADGNKKEVEQISTKHQSGNHNLLIYFLSNIDRQLGNKDWATKEASVQDNRSINIRIDGPLESERISNFARGWLIGEKMDKIGQESREGSKSNRTSKENNKITRESD